ncbi:protein of unknown function [Cyanobium sp. NIES-981]|nr:protein of unknown function [Cyanobium sp. NIES-981]
MGHPEQVLGDRYVIVRKSVCGSVITSIREQNFRIACHRACEEYSQLLVHLPKPLDDILKQHATLAVPNLMCFVHDERTDI